MNTNEKKNHYVNLPAVLVLGDAGNKKIINAVFDSGKTPVVRNSLKEALRHVRNEQCSAVVVDAKHAEVDLLEFILNVRDFNDSLRIFVVNERKKSSEQKLPYVPSYVYFTTPEEMSSKLTPSIIDAES